MSSRTRPCNPLPEYPPMSDAELRDLSREAGRPLSNEEGHRFRRDRIHQQEAEHFVYGKRVQRAE